jgi:hypothetical protein
MPRWVKVEFYGLVPDDHRVEDLDPLEVGTRLMQAFGFTHLDQLAVRETQEEHDRHQQDPEV